MNKKNKHGNSKFNKILILLLLFTFSFSSLGILTPTQTKAGGAKLWQSQWEKNKGWGETFNSYTMLNDITGDYELSSTIAIDSNKDLKDYVTNVVGECQYMPWQVDGTLKEKASMENELINCNGTKGKKDDMMYPYTWIGMNTNALKSLINDGDKGENNNCTDDLCTNYKPSSSVKVGTINAGEVDSHQASIASANIVTQLNSALRFVNAEEYAKKKNSTDKNKNKNSSNIYKTGTSVGANTDKYLSDINKLAYAMTTVAGTSKTQEVTLASGTQATVTPVSDKSKKKTSYPKELGLNADIGVTDNQLVEIKNSQGKTKVFLAKASRGYNTDSILHPTLLNMVIGTNVSEDASNKASTSISKLSTDYLTSSQAAYQAAYLYYSKNDDDRIPAMKSRVGILQDDNVSDIGGMFGTAMSWVAGFMNSTMGVSDPGDWMLQEGEVNGYTYRLMPPDIYDLAMIIFWISAGFGVVIAVVSLQSRLALASRATGDDSVLLRRQAITSFFIGLGSIALFYPLFLLAVQINNAIFDAIKSQFVWEGARVTLQGLGLGGLSAMFAPVGWMMLSISVMTYGLTRMVNIFLYLVTMPILLSRLDTNSNNKFVLQGIHNLVFNIFIVNAWLLAYIFALNLQSSFQHSTTWIIIVLGVLFMGVTPALKKLFNVSGGIDTGIAAAAGAYTAAAAGKLIKGAREIGQGGLNKAAGHQMGMAQTLGANAKRDIQETALGRKDGLAPETEGNLKKAKNRMRAAGALSGLAGFVGGAGLAGGMAMNAKSKGEIGALQKAAKAFPDKIHGNSSSISEKALKEQGAIPTRLSNGKEGFANQNIAKAGSDGMMSVNNKMVPEKEFAQALHNQLNNDKTGIMKGTTVEMSGGSAGTHQFRQLAVDSSGNTDVSSLNAKHYGKPERVSREQGNNLVQKALDNPDKYNVRTENGITYYDPKVEKGASMDISYTRPGVDTLSGSTGGNKLMSTPLADDGKTTMHNGIKNAVDNALRDTLNSNE